MAFFSTIWTHSVQGCIKKKKKEQLGKWRGALIFCDGEKNGLDGTECYTLAVCNLQTCLWWVGGGRTDFRRGFVKQLHWKKNQSENFNLQQMRFVEFKMLFYFLPKQRKINWHCHKRWASLVSLRNELSKSSVEMRFDGIKADVEKMISRVRDLEN